MEDLILLTECLPPEECPTLFNYVDIEVEMSEEPGMMRVMNKSGCCPKLDEICDQRLCPPTPVCPEYYTLNKNLLTSACCPDYECSEYKQRSYTHRIFTLAPYGGTGFRIKIKINPKFYCVLKLNEIGIISSFFNEGIA